MRDGRVNGYEADWCEVVAATRYRLERVDENVCDAYTTDETPLHAAGVPVEVKSCRRRISDGHDSSLPGRFTVHGKMHEELEDRDGRYALPVYEHVDVGDRDHVDRDDGRGLVVRRCALFPASLIGELMDEWTRKYQKLPWPEVYPSLDRPAVNRETVREYMGAAHSGMWP